MMELQNKRVAVVGMARSGLAAVHLLRARGAHVFAVDQRSADEIAGLTVELRPQNAEALRDAELIVLSPGVPSDIAELSDARARGVHVIGDVELASWFLRGPILGITGSNGKTTTTAMAGHILRESQVACQVGGNIGTPLASMVETSRDDQWNVLELSSFQLEMISTMRVRIAVALNVTPDHLDRHYTFENYAAAKARMFETQRPGDFAVLNADDATCASYAAKTQATPVWFSSAKAVSPGAYLDGGRIILDREALMPAADVPLRGAHNLENTMAAAAACRLAGAQLEQIAAAVRTFPGVEHRIEFVRERDGVRYYNDSKATNVDATEKAIDSFDGGLWIILGGKDKNSDYTVLRERLRRKAKGILLIGAAAEKIAQQLGMGLPLAHHGTIENAVRAAASQASAGDTVLLAPACASFDQFENYEHRGRVFKSAVREL